MDWISIVYYCIVVCFGIYVLIRYIRMRKKYKNIDNKEDEYKLLVSEHMALFGPLATEKILVKNITRQEKIILFKQEINNKNNKGE